MKNFTYTFKTGETITLELSEPDTEKINEYAAFTFVYNGFEGWGRVIYDNSSENMEAEIDFYHNIPLDELFEDENTYFEDWIVEKYFESLN